MRTSVHTFAMLPYVNVLDLKSSQGCFGREAIRVCSAFRGDFPMPASRTVNTRRHASQLSLRGPRNLDLAEYTADMIEQLEQMYRRMGYVRTASLLRAALKSSEKDFAALRKT
jgi:hypothetical protein